MEGVGRRLRREHNERMTVAWHTAALTRAKKLPKLATLLASKPEAPRVARQPWEDQLAVARQWTAALNRTRGR